MMHLNWQNTPAVTGVTEAGHIVHYRSGEPTPGVRFKLIIVRIDHPNLQHELDRDWIRYAVRPRLAADGQWLEVTSPR